MKWFQLDSDTPNDPKVKAIIRRGLDEPVPGQAAAGALLLLWCYIANHGGGTPGHGVDSAGEPLPLDEMADECLFSSQAGLQVFLDFLADKRHIDPDVWREQRIVLLPAMETRADAYAKSKGRGKAGPDDAKRANPGNEDPEEAPTGHHSTGTNPTTGTDGLLFGTVPTVKELVDVWNTTRTKGPKVERITKQRQGAYTKALRDHPNLEDWERVIAWLDREAWANAPGTGSHATWRADLDYLCRPGKLQKALERVRTAAPVQSGGRGRVTATPGKYAQHHGPDHSDQPA